MALRHVQSKAGTGRLGAAKAQRYRVQEGATTALTQVRGRKALRTPAAYQTNLVTAAKIDGVSRQG